MFRQWLLIGACLLLFSSLALADESALETFVSPFSQASLSSLHNVAHEFRRSRRQGQVAFSLASGQGDVSIQLEPHDIRAAKYRAQITGESGTYRDPARVDLFRGQVFFEKEEGVARFSLIRNRQLRKDTIRGFLFLKHSYFDVSSVNESSSALSVKKLSAEEFRALVAKCGVDRLPILFHPALVTSEERITSLRQAEIATEADKEYTDVFSGSISSANAEILSILNAVDAIYRAQLGVTFTVTFQHAWTSTNDPYTSTDPSTLLDEFINYWEQNYSSSESYDAAHLWTGKNIDGGVVGIASLDAVCSPFRYGLSQRIGTASYDVPLAAHEIGHNFAAEHDVCNNGETFMMCPVLVQNASQFSSTSIAAVRVALPFFDCLGTVSGSGRAPYLAPIGAKSVSENSLLQITPTATDADGDILTFSVSSLPVGAAFNSNVFRYTPPYSTVANGSYATVVSVVFTVTDTTGLQDSETVPITVLNVNRSPSLSQPPLQTVAEGSLFSYQLHATDADRDTLVYGAPHGLPAGAVLNRLTGVFSFRPAGNQSGVYSIHFRVADGYGGKMTKVLSLTVTEESGIPDLPASYHHGDLLGRSRAQVSLFRPQTGVWYYSSFGSPGTKSRQGGLPGDIPVPGDYNGDNITDIAVFRPSTNTWYIRYSRLGVTESVSFGQAGDIPCPADYDGDGRTNLGVFRPSQGLYLYRKGGTDYRATLGTVGDIPVPGDYNGDGIAERAVYSPGSGNWTILYGLSRSVIHYGQLGDIPVPADYDGNGTTDIAFWRPSTGDWYVRRRSIVLRFGQGGDVPVPADLNGDGVADFLIWRPQSQRWYQRILGQTIQSYQFGAASDISSIAEPFYFAARTSQFSSPQALAANLATVQLYDRSQRKLYDLGTAGQSVTTLTAPTGSYILRGDYDGDGLHDTAVFTAGVWTLIQTTSGVETKFWGLNGDIPVSGDFDGDGTTDIAVYRPIGASGGSQWYVIRSTNGGLQLYNWGVAGDSPVPADFNGDGWTDPAIWRPSTGTWFVLDGRSGKVLQSVTWGMSGDTVRVADFDRDGRADKIVWRGGLWYLLLSGGGRAGVAWGLPGDIPVPAKYLSTSVNDYAVFRPSTRTLYILSQTGTQQIIPAQVRRSASVVALTPAVVVP